MKTISIVLTFAAIISILGCGVIGQTPGGTVAPSIATFKNVIARSYDNHKTYDNIVITIPAGTRRTDYRVLFDVDPSGIDPATLTRSRISQLYPLPADQESTGAQFEDDFVNCGDISIRFCDDGNRELILLLSGRPKFRFGNSPILELPISKENLDSYLGKPERLLKRGELP